MSENRFARTRDDHRTETAEDYVELIEALIKETGEARTVDLADRLGVSAATVTKTVGRLQRDGYIETEPYRSIFLTAEGRRLAGAMRERHETVLRFLLALGVPHETAEVDAEGIEHHVSELTLQAMRAFVEKNA